MIKRVPEVEASNLELRDLLIRIVAMYGVSKGWSVSKQLCILKKCGFTTAEVDEVLNDGCDKNEHDE